MLPVTSPHAALGSEPCVSAAGRAIVVSGLTLRALGHAQRINTSLLGASPRAQQTLLRAHPASTSEAGKAELQEACICPRAISTLEASCGPRVSGERQILE